MCHGTESKQVKVRRTRGCDKTTVAIVIETRSTHIFGNVAAVLLGGGAQAVGNGRAKLRPPGGECVRATLIELAGDALSE